MGGVFHVFFRVFSSFVHEVESARCSPRGGLDEAGAKRFFLANFAVCILVASSSNGEFDRQRQ